MADLTKLAPREVWSEFEAITRVPRPSKKEEKIRDYLVGWAEEHGSVRCDGQRRDPQAGHGRLRAAADGDSPVAYGYGVREEFGRGVRFRARRDPHAHRRRLGACRGDDARGRRRHRHGRCAGDAGLRQRGTSGARGTLHGRRGDRPDGSLRAGRGDADGQVPR